MFFELSLLLHEQSGLLIRRVRGLTESCAMGREGTGARGERMSAESGAHRQNFVRPCGRRPLEATRDPSRCDASRTRLMHIAPLRCLDTPDNQESVGRLVVSPDALTPAHPRETTRTTTAGFIQAFFHRQPTFGSKRILRCCSDSASASSLAISASRSGPKEFPLLLLNEVADPLSLSMSLQPPSPP